MRRVRVAADRWNFELDGTGEFITPIGGNMLDNQHPGQGTLFDRFDAADCDRRFGIMADHDLNCLRQAIGVNHIFDPVNGLKADGMRNWDTFIGLAEKHGIYLIPVGGYLGGNDWFDSGILADNGKSADESAAFWTAFTGHYAGHPAIWAWDLRNELYYDYKRDPTTPGASDEQKIEAMLKDGWPAWLMTRYDSVDALNRAHGASYAKFEDVPGSVHFAESPFDMGVYDFRCYLNDRGYAWCKRECEAIRTADPTHMICSGNNTWLFPDMDLMLATGFHNVEVHDLFDFVTHHPYPAPQCVPGRRGDPLDGGDALIYWLHSCIGMSRIDYYGKPVVLQEFGWYGGGESRFLCELPYRSEQEHADYTKTLCETLTPHVNGFINWPTMDMPDALDISNHGGIFTADGRPKALAAVYSAFSRNLVGKRQVRARGTVTIQSSLLGLYTSRGYQDRFWDQIHQTLVDGEIPDFRFI